jgi:hypothetical protein
MNTDVWLPIIIAALSLGFTALAATLGVIVRTVRHQTTVEDKLDNVIKDVEDLVADKDKVHTAIFTQMQVDRDATDKRLRYLEEFWISIGRQKVRNLSDVNATDD